MAQPRRLLVFVMLLALIALPALAGCTTVLPSTPPGQAATARTTAEPGTIFPQPVTTGQPAAENQQTIPWPPDPRLLPPPATLTVDDLTQRAEVGTFCWRAAAAGFLCANAIGIPTTVEPLAIQAPVTLTLRLPLQETPDLLLVQTIPVAPDREMAGTAGGQRWWPYEPGQRYEVKPGAVVALHLALQPGLYVLHVSARWPAQGQVDYGFLLTVPITTGLLDVYPLAAGTSWVYSATVNAQTESGLQRWQGRITETVTSAAQRGNAWIFEVTLSGHPLRSLPGDRFYRYVLLDGRLYQLPGPQDPAVLLNAQGQGFARQQILTWPLVAGKVWGDPDDLTRGDGLYVWQVLGREDLQAPTGVQRVCYRVSLLTNADDTSRWFCPSIGIARYEYHHHGTVHDEIWELIQPERPIREARDIIRTWPSGQVKDRTASQWANSPAA